MRKHYTNFSKEKFEFALINIRQKHSLNSWTDITEQLEKETGNKYWEHVYKFSTSNPHLDILIYSSIDRRTGRVREKSEDAVRVVYRLRKYGGILYKKVHKHQRIDTLFVNLETTIVIANSGCNNFSKDGWVKSDSMA